MTERRNVSFQLYFSRCALGLLFLPRVNYSVNLSFRYVVTVRYAVFRRLQINTRSFGGIALNIALLLFCMFVIPIVSFSQWIVGAVVKSLILNSSWQMISGEQ
jgi:hypothetical protein